MGFSLNGLSLVGRGVRTSNSDLRHAAGDTRYGTKGLPAKPGNFGGLGSLPSATPTIRTSPMDTSCLAMPTNTYQDGELLLPPGS